MKLVAIINITPDSFSDGRSQATTGDYIQLINQAIVEGADILDIGAESTRPNATLISPEEEWSRLEPVLTTCNLQPATLSLDTRHPQTFRKALQYGAKWFNDVSGFQNPESLTLAKECGCDIVLMHSLTVPADPKVTFPEGTDVVKEVYQWANKRIAELQLPKEKIIFDPGIGFGKTAVQSWDLIKNISVFKALGVRIMVGHSRKSFLGLPMEQRDAATAEITRKLAENGVDYARVHNIKVNRFS
jgi:dihydropteroate synthase